MLAQELNRICGCQLRASHICQSKIAHFSKKRGPGLGAILSGRFSALCAGRRKDMCLRTRSFQYEAAPAQRTSPRHIRQSQDNSPIAANSARSRNGPKFPSEPCGNGRGGGTRTPGPRFWRPMLYQLSYTPIRAPPLRQSRSRIKRKAPFASRMLAGKEFRATATQEGRSPRTAFPRGRNFLKFALCRARLRRPVFCGPCQSRMFETTPEPTVRPPSRMAKRRPFSIAIGAISSAVNFRLSPGITISVPSGSVTVPVTSVVRK